MFLGFVMQSNDEIRDALAGYAEAEVLAEIERKRADEATEASVTPEEENKRTRGPEAPGLDTFLAVDSLAGVDEPGSHFFARRIAAPARKSIEARRYIDRVVQVHRLREVRALVGFTRFEAPVTNQAGDLDLEIGVHPAPLASHKQWVPAVENHGEGVFFALDGDHVREWAAERAVREGGPGMEDGRMIMRSRATHWSEVPGLELGQHGARGSGPLRNAKPPRLQTSGRSTHGLAAKRSPLHLYVILAAVALASTDAYAQTTSDPDERVSLLNRAVAAREAGMHEEALRLFREAGQIQMRPGLRLSIAQELLELRRPTESCTSASHCMSEAQLDLRGSGSATALEECASILTRTCSSFARIRVRIPQGSDSEMSIRLNGQGVPTRDAEHIFVEASTVDLLVEHRQRIVATESPSLTPGSTHEVVVRLDPPESRPLAPSPLQRPYTGLRPIRRTDGEGGRFIPTRRPAAQDDTAPVMRSEAASVSGPGAGPWIVGGVGLAAFAAAGIFYGLRGNALQDRAAACDATLMFCTPAAESAQGRAESATLLTNVAIGVGVTGIAAGLVWYLVDSPSSSSRPSAFGSLSISVASDGAIFSMGGLL